MKTLHFNDGKHPITLGGITIPPGQARDIDAHLVPTPTRVAAIVDTFAHLQDLMAKTVKDIAAQVGSLSEAELCELQALEESNNKPRAGVLDAINGAMLSLQESADEAAHDDRQRRLAELQELTLDQLTELAAAADAPDAELIAQAIALKEDAQ